MLSLLWTRHTPHRVRAHFWESHFLNLCSITYSVMGPALYISQHVYIKISESVFIRTLFPFSLWYQHLSTESRNNISQTNNPRPFHCFKWKSLLIMCLVSVQKGCTPESKRMALACQRCCYQWEMTAQYCHQRSRFYCYAYLLLGCWTH